MALVHAVIALAVLEFFVFGMLVGIILAGGASRSSILADPEVKPTVSAMKSGKPALAPGGLVNFADVVDRVNPAVVNIEATSRGARRGCR